MDVLLKKLTWNLVRIQAICLIVSGVSFAASSGSASNATSVAANVSANCHVNNAIMNFGDYDPVSKNATAPLTGVTSFQIACTKGASASISLSAGNNSSHATGTTRAMSTGGATSDYISYELYTNTGYSTVWNASNIIQYVASSRRTNTITVYGKIPAGQDVSAGYYTDTVSIVANF